MRLIDALPKSPDGMIVLNPAGESGGTSIAGEVSPALFTELFPELANAPVPLDSGTFAALKSIDRFWAENAERWRSEGII